MKSILELLGLGGRESPTAGDTQTVRKIVRALEEMDPQRARFLAAFAYLLGRIAHADLDISEEETRSMERIVQEFGDLPESQAVLVVEIAKSHAASVTSHFPSPSAARSKDLAVSVAPL